MSDPFSKVANKLDFSKYDAKQLAELSQALVELQDHRGWRWFCGILEQMNRNRAVENSQPAVELTDILKSEFRKGEFRATLEIVAMPAGLVVLLKEALDKHGTPDDNHTQAPAVEIQPLPDERK